MSVGWGPFKTQPTCNASIDPQHPLAPYLMCCAIVLPEQGTGGFYNSRTAYVKDVVTNRVATTDPGYAEARYDLFYPSNDSRRIMVLHKFHSTGQVYEASGPKILFEELDVNSPFTAGWYSWSSTTSQCIGGMSVADSFGVTLVRPWVGAYQQAEFRQVDTFPVLQGSFTTAARWGGMVARDSNNYRDFWVDGVKKATDSSARNGSRGPQRFVYSADGITYTSAGWAISWVAKGWVPDDVVAYWSKDPFSLFVPTRRQMRFSSFPNWGYGNGYLDPVEVVPPEAVAQGDFNMIRTSFGPTTAYTNTTFNGLFYGAMANVANADKIDNTTTGYDDVYVEVTIANVNATADKIVGFYVVTSQDGTNWSDSSQHDISVLWSQVQNLLGTVRLNGTGPWRSHVMSVRRACGGTMPAHWAILVHNNAGVQLAGVGNSIQYRGVNIKTAY